MERIPYLYSQRKTYTPFTEKALGWRHFSQFSQECDTAGPGLEIYITSWWMLCNGCLIASGYISSGMLGKKRWSPSDCNLHEWISGRLLQWGKGSCLGVLNGKEDRTVWLITGIQYSCSSSLLVSLVPGLLWVLTERDSSFHCHLLVSTFGVQLSLLLTVCLLNAW